MIWPYERKRVDSLSEDHKEKRQPGAVMSFLVFGAAIAVLLLGGCAA